ALEEIRFNTGLTIQTIVVEVDKLNSMIEAILSEAAGAAFKGLDDDLDNIDVDTSDGDAQEDSASGADDAPIVRFVNKLLLEIVKMAASDLHFEPYERNYRVRFRQDGILREITSPPVSSANKIAA